MSKSVLNRRDQIRDKALEMFNERGIEYVGLREIAGVLEMRVSNITYYFPTKDDLVYELTLQLSKANAAIIVADDGLNMSGFLTMMRSVFTNQLGYRCLMLSFVHVMAQNKKVAASYKKTQARRNTTIASNITALSAGGYLRLADEEEKDFLVSTLALISRFWISEAAISFKQWSEAAQIDHYLSMVAKLLLPYATAKGKREIAGFLSKD
jgi:AcrR family transcriptional regulator